MENEDEIKLIKSLTYRDGFIRNKGLSFCTVYDLIQGNVILDMDVFLPSIGMNLQRDLCWSSLQKEQFIISFCKRLYIPPYAIVHIKADITPIVHSMEVIDGKQRLSTLISFGRNEFSVPFLPSKKFYFMELPKRVQKDFLFTYLVGNIAYHYDDDPITDEMKIEWFSFINFSGTPVDEEHKLKLKKGKKEV